MESSANSPSCSWAPSTTAAPLRGATTASCGAQPLTTLMKTANMASAPTNVSLASLTLIERKVELPIPAKTIAIFQAALLILDKEKVGWAVCQERVVSCLDWSTEYSFSKSLPHFGAPGFAKHFVYLCCDAVHSTNMIARLLQTNAKVHMY